VYTSLLRLLQQGWIAAEWGTSDNSRKAKLYLITARGEKQLAVETAISRKRFPVRDPMFRGFYSLEIWEASCD
jgi:DNA-binding PadR family transcriptional regulator